MKKIFYLLLIGVMFLMPKNVFADSYTINWKTVWGYTNRDDFTSPTYTMPSPSEYSINSVDYWMYSHNDLPDANQFEFYTGTTDSTFDPNTTYNITGNVAFFGTYANASVDKEPLQIFKLLIREIGSTSEDTEYKCEFNLTNSHSTIQYFYKFTCNNIKLYKNTRFGIITDLQNRESNTVLISQQFNIQRNDTDSKMDAMIDEQQKTNEKLDGIKEEQQKTNEKLDGINDSITSTEGPDLGSLENSAGWLPAGPVDSILNLPLTLMNNIVTNLSKSCQPINITLPFVDKSMTLPCISTIYSQIEGLSVWINTISYMVAAIILFHYFMALYKWVDDTLSFRENNWNDTDQWGGV